LKGKAKVTDSATASPESEHMAMLGLWRRGIGLSVVLM
jgi:hypothetical protein